MELLREKREKEKERERERERERAKPRANGRLFRIRKATKSTRVTVECLSLSLFLLIYSALSLLLKCVPCLIHLLASGG